MRALLPLLLAVIAVIASAGEPGDAGVKPTVVTGRVTDETGRGLVAVSVTLIDGSKRSGYVDPHGCGTYYAQETVLTGADGRFTATLPFLPTRARVEPLQWVRFPEDPVVVRPGEPLRLVGQSIPHRVVTGVVVDDAGAPVVGARVVGSSASTTTDAVGRFAFELPEPASGEFRVRRMGFRPVVLSAAALDRVVLQERRPLVTVTVVDAATKQPVTQLTSVSLWQGAERLSFCSAGRADETHEATNGACTLDAEPGAVTLKVDDQPVRSVRVTKAPQQALTVTVTLAPPRVVGPLRGF
ncbi:MAG: carboxypeptidase regulatory-like domain-containing protein [Myxococcus sp.]|nr:carboxypeptidase regulatory-like domain-containing protein [Myxococcus sp.]